MIKQMYVIGMVHPSEYDWKKQFRSCARKARRNCEVERVFDVGKVIGLASAYEDLESENKRLMESALELNEEYRNLITENTRLRGALAEMKRIGGGG